MPSISLKGRLQPASPIRKLNPYADKARQKGKHIYHLNIGQPDIETPKVALDAIKNNNIKILSYSPSQGFDDYRERLAQFYRENSNLPVETQDILITTGGSEALSFVMSSICDQDDEIIIPEPFYANYNGFANMVGARVRPVQASIDNNFALPPISAFERLISDKTRAILICNPGNPTGYLYTKREIEQLADLVKKHNLFLIADEVYREFAYDGAVHHSILNEKGIEENAIMVDSVSKRFSMCGARIGCIVTKNKEVLSTALKFAQARLSPPTFAQLASKAALEVPQSYFDNVKKEYVERRDTLIKGLKEIPGVKVGEPSGAFYCIAELPIKDSENFAQWLLESFDVDNETLMVAPAGGFYSSPNVGKNQVRLAYVLNKESLIKAVNILKEALKVYPQ